MKTFSRNVDASALRCPPDCDDEAFSRVRKIDQVARSSPEDVYGRGSWGYTVLRTTYSHESDALFPIAVEKLNRWIKGFWAFENLFVRQSAEFMYLKTDPIYNDVIAERFCSDIVEDREKLNCSDLQAASPAEVDLLGQRFDVWRISVGAEHGSDWSPRFSDCILIDDNSLASLNNLPEYPPDLKALFGSRVPAQTFDQWFDDGRAYVWLMDARGVSKYARDAELQQERPSARGWFKISLLMLWEAWDAKASYDAGTVLSCENDVDDEDPDSYWYDW